MSKGIFKDSDVIFTNYTVTVPMPARQASRSRLGPRWPPYRDLPLPGGAVMRIRAKLGVAG